MTSSLVGSEMCIRDRLSAWSLTSCVMRVVVANSLRSTFSSCEDLGASESCLLYTSDAADDM
eukprot:8394955-Prorocentrum_lima.AAC.1